MSTWYKRSKLGWDTLRRSRFVKDRDSVAAFGTAAALGGVFCGVLCEWETIPYSSRTHLVPKPSLLEKKVLGSFSYWMEKKLENWEELPATHPASLRLKPIADRVIGAANKVIRDENYNTNFFEWQVIVLDRPQGVVSQSLPPGKLLFDSGLLERFESDDEIAALMSNLVAHELARHEIELCCKAGALGVLFRLFLPRKINNNATALAATVLPYFALSRKVSREQKYIGMMIMARAGYDPGAAISVARRDPKPNLSFDLFSSVPSQRKILHFLGEAQDEAMVLYKERLSTP